MNLQRLVGNAAADHAVQRQPPKTGQRPRTQSWEHDESHEGRATMHRSTKIVADAWGEVGPRPPRITYRREIRLSTADGASVYLDLRGTVYLPQGAALPTWPEAAMDTIGLGTITDWHLKIEGADLVPVIDGERHEVLAMSLQTIMRESLPAYAQLPLTVERQEEAILRHLATLPRRPKEKPKDTGSVLDTVVAAGTDLLPVIGELKDAYRAITGRDPDTGEELRWWERALSGLFAIPFVGKLFKYAGKAFKWLGKGGKLAGGWLADKFRRWLGKRMGPRTARVAAKQLTHLKQIFDHPAVLAGKHPGDVGHIFSPQHWDVGPITGRSPGTKYNLKNAQGKVTGQIQVRWSSGSSGRHFRDAAGKGQPYWQISVANAKPGHVWIAPDGKMYSKPPTYKAGKMNQADPPVPWTGSLTLPPDVEQFLGLGGGGP
jgi:hypothetical protein